ncbi:unnamed protein product, partial [Candidula unifasciata]
MSTRSRRARGRPPKTPLSTNRTNFLRKPKAYQNQENLNSAGLSTVTHLRHGRSERIRGRAAAHKGRHFVSQLLAEDDDISSLPEFEDRSSDITDLDNTDAYGSDASYSGGSNAESSDDESLSTVSSSVSRRRLLLKRPKTPDIQDDKELPQLNLPPSATDLLLPAEHVLQAVGVYEILRHFRTILRLSPFTFEDFCACLLSEEQSNLLAEIHMTLLKALLREEENSGTTFGSQDLKDSINVSLYFLDSMTWPEILRSYLDSEKHPEYRTPLPTLECPDYPFVAYTEKLKVLQTLTDLFLATTKVREEIINEGNIHYDDHCRACHKLGDLLCCETCSAVYHLGCVEPPMQEVPEDDWLCSVCRAHQVKGVTDCVSEAERSGLMCRQEAIGYDRHARKYWFICRRIIVEGEKEVRYYSTKCQLEELLDSLDPEWEPDLISFINEMKEDIIKQMSITEELTAASKGSRKSVLEVENAQLLKLQAERALQRKEEEKKKAQEEEERKKKEDEEEKRKEDGLTDSGDNSKDEKASFKNNELHISINSFCFFETVESEALVSTHTKQVTNSVSRSSKGGVTTTELVETTTTISTVTSVKSITTTTVTASEGSVQDAESDEPSLKKSRLDSTSGQQAAEANSGIKDNSDASKTDSKLLLSSSSALSEAIKSTTEGKTKIISLHSLLPSARQSILNTGDKNGEDTKSDGPTKTVLLVNRGGGKVTLQVSRQPIGKDDQNGSSVTQTSTSSSVAVSGSEGSYKQYQNQYTTNTLALNKHQHNEERDKKRHLSHKFSLTQSSEFKWNGNVMGNRMSILATLRLTISQLEANIQAPFMHPNWPNHRQNWQKAVQMCQSPRDFALALTILEACIKPCVMNPVWHESLGHLRLNRITSTDREEFKKKEKEQKRRKEDEEEVRPIVWIKYTMGLKHQVWKQKGEEYRITGGNGWQWISSTRKINTVPQDSVGLRLIAHKLINRRVRAAKSCGISQKMDDGAEDKHTETESETQNSSLVTEDILTQKDNKPSLKEEMMETEEAAEENSNGNKEVKMEDLNEDSDMKSDGNVAGNVTTGESKLAVDVRIKNEPQLAENSNKCNIKGGVVKIQKGQSSCESYLTFLKKKYIEDKETAFALEVLKKPPEKVDVELINVSEAMQKRTYYAKLTKPYSKLDNLLERRLRQDEFEQKQRLTIETQIALKLKLQQASETAQKQITEKDEQTEKEIKLINGDISDDSSLTASNLYSCYSLLCRSGGNDKVGLCYSPMCRLKQQLDGRQQKALASTSVSTVGSESHSVSSRTSKEGSPDNLINEDSMDSHLSKGSRLSQEEDEANDIDVPGSKDNVEDGLNKENEEEQANNSHAVSSLLADKSIEDEDVDIEGDTSREIVAASADDRSEGNSIDAEKKPAASSSAENPIKSESSKASSVSEIVKNLVIKTIAEKNIAPNVGKESLLNNQTLSAAVANMSIEDLQARLPPKHPTSEKFKLARFTRIGVKKKISKHGRLPMCHKFETKSKKKSVLILDRNELKKMARQGAKRESALFNYNCKLSSVCWPYPCPRPLFKTAWRYRTMTLQSLSAAALQLRILWACIRWDDMAAKPPAGGTNTVSTETEITTTELLKRREAGMDGLRSEFLVRKIVVPLGVPDKPKEKYTPQRSGLRERKKIESVRQTEPSVTEVWVPEEVLELWEIKQFGEKLEKQRQALQDKVDKAAANQQTIVTSQQSSAQIKAQMEQQLKQQRLALAQKRIQENQGVKITTGNNLSAISTLASASATTIIINNPSQFGKAGATFKTLTVSSPSSLLSSGVIKTMQPKVVSANAGSLLGSQLRPGIRLQIPGSTIQIRPQTVLAPKPGATITTTSGVSTITRLISPAATTVARVLTPATPPATKTQTVQLRSQTPGAPVQNLHFTQTPGGQLQVRGLLPGQIIQRMPDGKLQIITLSTSAAASAPTTAALATSPAQQQQAPRAATVSIRPQAIMVSPSAGSAAMVTPTNTQNRLVIPAQLASSLSVVQSTSTSPLSVPAIRQVLASSVAGTPSKPIIVTRPGGPQIISAQNIASVLNHAGQSLGTSSAGTLVAASPVVSSLSSAVVISSPALINTVTAPTILTTSLAGVTTVLVNSSQPSQLSNVVSPPGQQTIISTLKPTVLNPSVTLAVTTTTTTIPGQSLLGGQIISGSSLIQRSTGGTSLINLNSASGLTSTVSVSPVSSQIPKLLASSPAGTQIITRPLGVSQSQLMLRPGTSMLTGAGQAKIITTQQLRGLTTSPIQLKTATASLSPVKTILSPQSSSVVVPAGGTSTLTAVRSLTPQLTIQTSAGTQQIIATGAATSLLPQGLTLTSSPESGTASISVTSPSPGTSPSSKASTPKYAITPQVVEQVVRQALLQNQTPEIQQKLLAMQKQIQQQQQPAASMAVMAANSNNSSGVTSVRRGFPSSTPPIGKQPSAVTTDQSRVKTKGLTQEQKEEQSRNSICGQVMKTILDRIEREEKQEQKNKKKQESAEEKHKRLTAINQQKALYKHKEALKKEILRKRSLMEKNLQQEIYNEMADKVKKTKTSVAKSPQAGSAVAAAAATAATTAAAAPLSATPVTLAAHARPKKVVTEIPKTSPSHLDNKSIVRKRKQKIISTGIKGLNPREKLYCVCKTPYDES